MEDKIKIIHLQNCSDFKEMEKKKKLMLCGVELPKKIIPAQAPSKQEMMNAVKNVWLITVGKKLQFIVIPVSEWAPQYSSILDRNKGEYFETLTSRIMAIVIFKKADGSCGFMNMQIEQK